MCQPPGSRARSQISDFRTKGEQPFTVLIEAQFAEQPPQNSNKRLPNQGRKVLVFSDGRQKAARLAPALEHSHARDLFRQVLSMAAHELDTQTDFSGMDKLYPAVVYVCNAHGINLFPESDSERDIFWEHLSRSREKTLGELVDDMNQGFLQPTLSYAQHLFSEMTDRYFSLNALALATVEEDPALPYLFSSFPDVGLTDEAIRVFFRNWVRVQLEARRFLPQGADISRFGEGWERPEGIDITNRAQLFPKSIQQFALHVLKDPSKAEQVENWLANLVRSSGIFRLVNNLYFVQPMGLSLNLKLESNWLRCIDCGRLYAETIENSCSALQLRASDQDLWKPKPPQFQNCQSQRFLEDHAPRL